MKKVIIWLSFIFFLMSAPCSARDFIVEFVSENYKEVRAPYSYSPIVYHSIQVTSGAGSKLLVLTGDDFHYRSWLRQFIAQGKAFIVKVPDEQADLFVKSSVFDVDVRNLHPVDLDLYKKGEKTSGQIRNDKGNYETPAKDRIQVISKKLAKTAGKDRLNKTGEQKKNLSSQNALKKKAEQEKARAEKKRAAQLAAQNAKQAELERLKNEETAKALAEQKKLEQERARERETFFKELARQRAEEDNQRRLEVDQRYEELKARLAQDDRLRNLELDLRNKDADQRWLELKNTLSL